MRPKIISLERISIHFSDRQQPTRFKLSGHTLKLPFVLNAGDLA